MDTYFYCLVRLDDSDRTYYYISDEGALPEGTSVVVPVGYENNARVATVTSCIETDAEHAPYPPEKTKHIFGRANEKNGRFETADDPLAYADEIDHAADLLNDKDYAGAFEWAAEFDTVRGCSTLTDMVVRCYEACIAHDIPEASMNLGSMYYNGTVVPRDFVRAYELYHEAAKAGLCGAITGAGYCWFYGRHAEVDYHRAYRYFSIGALLYDNANCLYKLGDMFAGGLGLPTNERYAFTLYTRALTRASSDDEDSRACLPDCLVRVGRCLLTGFGTEQDIEKAHALLSAALTQFYARRLDDPFVRGPIENAKELLRQAEDLLDSEIP